MINGKVACVQNQMYGNKKNQKYSQQAYGITVTPSNEIARSVAPSNEIIALFARLITHQPAVLFSQNEPATSNQPQPASSTLLSEQTSTSHQPPANRTGCIPEAFGSEYRGQLSAPSPLGRWGAPAAAKPERSEE
jgi:hypothetical protein